MGNFIVRSADEFDLKHPHEYTQRWELLVYEAQYPGRKFAITSVARTALERLLCQCRQVRRAAAAIAVTDPQLTFHSRNDDQQSTNHGRLSPYTWKTVRREMNTVVPR